VTNWPNWEIDSLQIAIVVNFYSAGVISDKFEGLPLILRKVHSLQIFLRFLKIICQGMDQDKDLESLGNTPIE
jgi:hypothetical protein